MPDEDMPSEFTPSGEDQSEPLDSPDDRGIAARPIGDIPIPDGATLAALPPEPPIVPDPSPRPAAHGESATSDTATLPPVAGDPPGELQRSKPEPSSPGISPNPVTPIPLTPHLPTPSQTTSTATSSSAPPTVPGTPTREDTPTSNAVSLTHNIPAAPDPLARSILSATQQAAATLDHLRAPAPAPSGNDHSAAISRLLGIVEEIHRAAASQKPARDNSADTIARIERLERWIATNRLP